MNELTIVKTNFAFRIMNILYYGRQKEFYKTIKVVDLKNR